MFYQNLLLPYLSKLIPLLNAEDKWKENKNAKKSLIFRNV